MANNVEHEYSDNYSDDIYEYRHVILTKNVSRQIPMPRKELLTENAWRKLGVQQSRGWEHYMWHQAEPRILLFKRLLGTDPLTGKLFKSKK